MKRLHKANDADDANDLVRQPADGYTTIRFGSWATATTGELDRWCTFPRTVYGLSVVAMYDNAPGYHRSKDCHTNSFNQILFHFFASLVRAVSAATQTGSS